MNEIWYSIIKLQDILGNEFPWQQYTTNNAILDTKTIETIIEAIQNNQTSNQIKSRAINSLLNWQAPMVLNEEEHTKTCLFVFKYPETLIHITACIERANNKSIGNWKILDVIEYPCTRPFDEYQQMYS